MQGAWDDTYAPITDAKSPEVRAYVGTLSQDQQNTITQEEAIAAATARLKKQHSMTIPITENLVTLMFVSLADLTQDLKPVLTSLMVHRNQTACRLLHTRVAQGLPGSLLHDKDISGESC